MDEFVSVEEIIKRIKDIAINAKMKLYSSNDVLIFDYDVAALLHITDVNLATMKKRNRPPLKEILQFCQLVGIDPMKILF